MGRDDDLHASAKREFGGGIVALAILCVANKANPQITTEAAFWPILIFFTLGLGSLALAGLEQDRQIQGASTSAGLGVNRHWLGLVGGVIGLILAGAVAVAAVVSPDSIAGLGVVFDMVGIALIQGIGLVLYMVALILLPVGELIARVLLSLLQIFAGISLLLHLDFSAPTPEAINAAAQQLARTPPFRVIELIVMVCVVALLFRLAVRRLRRLNGQALEDEEHESVFSRELLWQQLGSLFVRRTKPALVTLSPYLALTGSADDPRLAVRRVYQAFLEWARTHDHERLAGQTPTMLAETLAQATPQGRMAVLTLTEAYLHARYGLGVTVEEAAQAQAALRALVEKP